MLNSSSYKNHLVYKVLASYPLSFSDNSFSNTMHCFLQYIPTVLGEGGGKYIYIHMHLCMFVDTNIHTVYTVYCTYT